MAGSYGVDVRALDDLPDPEVLASEDENVAYALARRLLQPDDALEEIGDDEDFDCLDLRDYLGESMSDQDLRDLEARVVRVMSQDPRVSSIESSVTLNEGALNVDVDGFGVDGPFSFVLDVSQLSVSLLVGE